MQRDEFLARFSITSNSEEANRWFVLKVQEALEEIENSSKQFCKKVRSVLWNQAVQLKSIFQLFVHHLLLMRFRF